MGENREDLVLSFRGEQVDVVSAIDKILKSLEGMEKRLAGTEEKAKKAAAGIGDFFRGLAPQVSRLSKELGWGVAGVGLYYAFSRSVEAARKFGQETNRLTLMLGGKGTEAVARYKKAILDLAKDSDNSIAELTRGMQQVVLSGIKGTESVEGATKMLKLAGDAASATLGDTGEAARTIGLILNAYGRKAEDAAGMTDELVVASQRSGISFGEFGHILSRMAPQASSLGFRFEDLVAVLVAMRKSGLDSYQSMFSLQSLMMSLSHPTGEMRKLLVQWGGEGGLVGLLDKMRASTRGNTAEINRLIPGARSMAGVTTLLGAGYDKLKESLDEVTKAGTGLRNETEEGAKMMEGTLGGRLKKVANQIDELKIALGEGIVPVLTTIAKLVSLILEGWQQIFSAQNWHEIAGFMGPGIAERAAQKIQFERQVAWQSLTGQTTGMMEGMIRGAMTTVPKGAAEPGSKINLPGASPEGAKRAQDQMNAALMKAWNDIEKARRLIEDLRRASYDEMTKFEDDYARKRESIGKELANNEKARVEALYLLDMNHIEAKAKLERKISDEKYRKEQEYQKLIFGEYKPGGILGEKGWAPWGEGAGAEARNTMNVPEAFGKVLGEGGWAKPPAQTGLGWGTVGAAVAGAIPGGLAGAIVGGAAQGGPAGAIGAAALKVIEVLSTGDAKSLLQPVIDFFDNLGPNLNKIITYLIEEGGPRLLESILASVPKLVWEVGKALANVVKRAIFGDWSSSTSWLAGEEGLIPNEIPILGLLHEGGMVEKTASTLSGAADMFMHAARAHSGMYVKPRLNSDEVPIIAKVGEAVMNSDWVRNSGGRAAVDAQNVARRPLGGDTTVIEVRPQFMLAKDAAAVIDELMTKRVKTGTGGLAGEVRARRVPGFRPKRSA